MSSDCLAIIPEGLRRGKYLGEFINDELKDDDDDEDDDDDDVYRQCCKLWAQTNTSSGESSFC